MTKSVLFLHFKPFTMSLSMSGDDCFCGRFISVVTIVMVYVLHNLHTLLGCNLMFSYKTTHITFVVRQTQKCFLTHVTFVIITIRPPPHYCFLRITSSHTVFNKNLYHPQN